MGCGCQKTPAKQSAQQQAQTQQVKAVTRTAQSREVYRKVLEEAVRGRTQAKKESWSSR